MSIESRVITNELLEDEIILHKGFDKWADNHVGGYLKKLPYDPITYPHQRIDAVNISPEAPSLEKAYAYGCASVGEESFNKMISGIKNHPARIREVVHNRLDKGLNALVATGHVKNVWDTALSYTATFCAMEDEEFAERNVILVNAMMSRIGVGEVGIPITELLSISGRVVKGIPDTASAQRAGVPSPIIKHSNMLAAKELIGLLKTGVVMHQAPTETVAVPAKDHQRLIPRASDQMAKHISKRIEYTIPWPMWLSDVPNQTISEVMDPRYITSPDQLHFMMSDMAHAISQQAKESGESVAYSPPASLITLSRLGQSALSQH